MRRKREDAAAAHSTDNLDLIFNPENEDKLRQDKEAAKRQAQEIYEKMDFEKGYDSLFELMWYSQMPCFDMISVTSLKDHEFGEEKPAICKFVCMGN